MQNQLASLLLRLGCIYRASTPKQTLRERHLRNSRLLSLEKTGLRSNDSLTRMQPCWFRRQPSEFSSKASVSPNFALFLRAKLRRAFVRRAKAALALVTGDPATHALPVEEVAALLVRRREFICDRKDRLSRFANQV